MLQTRKPDRLIIVDGSPDDETERAVRNRQEVEKLAHCLTYFRLSASLRGLTRQRNFALQWVATDKLAFFDDDVALSPECLIEMQNTLCAEDRVIGVGAVIQHQLGKPNIIWRLRRLLRVVPNLRPGSYCRSGMSIPWAFLASCEDLTEGEWLSGCGAMWRTQAVREVRFNEGFGGYAQGEDLDFSLRVRPYGKLVLASRARLDHLQEESGRPDHYKLGYMAIYNRYQIHRRCLSDRDWKDVLWFTYAWTIDSLLLMRHFLYPARVIPTLKQLAGRFKGAYDAIMDH